MTETAKIPSCLASVAREMRNHHGFVGSDADLLVVILKFLDDLSGASISRTMWALRRGFGGTKRQMNEFLAYWMVTYEERHPKQEGDDK